MPTFKVLRRVDAWVNSVATIHATSAQEAAELAEWDEGSYKWQELGVSAFDARGFVALDENGDEIEDSRVGDF